MGTVDAARNVVRTTGPSANEVLAGFASNEVVFAVVGHVGSGTSEIAEALQEILSAQHYDATILKARVEIVDWASSRGMDIPADGSPEMSKATRLQDLGDEMRRQMGDNSAVARALVRRIRATRAAKLGVTLADGAVVPDGSKRAYILDALRHPAEVELLKGVYGEAFALIGVVCEESVREARITKKYRDAGRDAAQAFMARDARAPERHGQRVAEAFHLADLFVDNSAPRFLPEGSRRSNPSWDINDKLGRLVAIVGHSDIVRPTADETAMYYAYGAQMRSACLSRQVGSALMDRVGNVVATGTNEVPKAGGGLYGEDFANEHDERCAFRRAGGHAPFCSNTREQNRIIDELLHDIPELTAGKDPAQVADLKLRLRRTRIGVLIEFSRAVHAEMAALLSAARKGVSPVGGRLFVTTFPCHYCARHLVAAGVDEVQFIEPYLKSKALALHDDAITTDPKAWIPPSAPATARTPGQDANGDGQRKVLFRPFTGVAPRLYRRAFLKDRDLKDDNSGELRISSPAWGSPWQLRRASYVELEAHLARDEAAS